MRRVTNRTILVLSGTVLFSGGLAGWMRAGAFAAEQTTPRGRYSPAQIGAMADRVARRLAPECRFEATEVGFLAVPPDSCKPCREWVAECSGGGDRIGLAWNADTGRLARVSCTFAAPASAGNRLHAGEAIPCGYRWLRDLEVIDASPSWRLDGRPERNGVAWVLRFRSGRDRVTAYIDRGNGRLLYAYVWL